MSGCNDRMKSREYYTEFAEKLPKDTVILTVGCAKYRYNKLPLGYIGGIPRVLDAGQSCPSVLKIFTWSDTSGFLIVECGKSTGRKLRYCWYWISGR